MRFALLFLLLPMLGYAEVFTPFTTLRPGGNEEIAKRYQGYLDSKQECRAVNNGPRMILTGFGIWNNTTISYSGFLIDNLASQEFWPAQTTRPLPAENYTAKNGVLGGNEGARIVNRTFRLRDGREVSACLIIADVLWDFAGAVLATEMERFQPNAVIMMGVGGAVSTIEGGAMNVASPMAGYYPNGSPDELNVPVSRGILPGFAEGSTLSMSWDVRTVADVARHFEPNVVVRTDADRFNSYICNNISYIALQAVNGAPLDLVDGQIKLRPRIQSRPQIGFFHFRVSAGGDLPTLKNYSEMILAIAAKIL